MTFDMRSRRFWNKSNTSWKYPAKIFVRRSIFHRNTIYRGVIIEVNWSPQISAHKEDEVSFSPLFLCASRKTHRQTVSASAVNLLRQKHNLAETLINVLLKWTLVLAGPHTQAIQISCQLCSNVNIKDSWAHQILQRAHKKFGNLHVFEWDMGHWPILTAHHHFGLGLTLNVILTGTQVLGRITVSEIKKCSLFSPLLAEWARLMLPVLKYTDISSKSKRRIGFIQGSLSKIQGLFKDFSRLFYSFQGLKVSGGNTDRSVKILLQKC